MIALFPRSMRFPVQNEHYENQSVYCVKVRIATRLQPTSLLVSIAGQTVAVLHISNYSS